MKVWLDIRIAAAAATLGVVACEPVARAELLPVANGSFESPTTTFVTIALTGWHLAGPPDTRVAGAFTNNSTPVDNPAHFTNAVGDQLAFIGTETGNSCWQLIPDSAFEANRGYRLSVGVAISLSLPPAAPDALRLRLFYVDDASHRQYVATTDVFNTPENALAANTIKYFDAFTPLLDAQHPAVGRAVGIELTAAGVIGHYFDMDDVTVEAIDPISAPEVLVPGGGTVSTPEPGALSVAGVIMLFSAGRRARRGATSNQLSRRPCRPAVFPVSGGQKCVE